VLTTSLPQLGSGNGTEGGETSIPFLLSRDPEAFNDGSPFNGGCSLIHCPPGATPHGGNREPPWKGSRAGRKSATLIHIGSGTLNEASRHKIEVSRILTP